MIFVRTMIRRRSIPLADRHAGSQTKSEVSKAIVRRAWQAAVLGAFGFPPLGFYSFRLLWKLAGRNTPLGTADRWRVTLAYILSVIAVLYCLLFVAAVAYLFVAAVAYLFVAAVAYLFVAAVAYLFVAAVAYLFVAIVNRPY